MVGHPQTFGPRHVLTRNDRVFDFLDGHVPLRSRNDHLFLTYVELDVALNGYPIHRDDIEGMPNCDQIEDQFERVTYESAGGSTKFGRKWMAFFGQTLYEKLIDYYSGEMWQIQSSKLSYDCGWYPKGVALKDGAGEAWGSAISAYP